MIFVYARFYLPVVLRKFKSKAQTLKKGFAFRTGQDWKKWVLEDYKIV